MRKYLRHLIFMGGNANRIEDLVNSEEFDNCEFISVNTYTTDEMEIVHELWYWFIVEY